MIRVDNSGSSSALIQVRGVNKTYRRGGENIQVLQGLNLDVPTSGHISVDGDEITHMSASKLTQWRARHVGFIFQMYNLIPVMTAFQNVELPLLLTKLSKAER